ncbi:MAG: putative metalloprotease CJM1_0395 family protein [Gammaproteobacteria bacterium]|nr:putative metalloprotease CJM1_0395 family protein [Gammaproteobacteria bacterium]
MDISTAIQASNLSQVANSSNSIQSNSLFALEKGVEKEDETPFAKQKAGESADKVTLSDKTDGSGSRDPHQTSTPSGEVLSDEEQRQVQELKRRDTEVKAHEQAHLSAAGNLSRGSASFSYETGPDGNRYAVGGEVNIDTSGVSGDPQATLAKAQKIRRAATAPADPSSQDRSVAAQASQMEAQARTDISQQALEKSAGQDAELSNDKGIQEAEFAASQAQQNEKNIQDSYKEIQNTSVLEMQKHSVDFFI